MSTPSLNRQLSVRLSDDQRAFVQQQADELRRDPTLAHIKWHEADVVRHLIDAARANGHRVTTWIRGRSA